MTFSDISFTPFRHFPNAALVLHDFALKESKDSIFNSSAQAVFNFNEAYVSLNIVDLFSSRINVSDITIERGILNLIVYSDNTSNLAKAISKRVDKDKLTTNKPIKTDSAYRKTKQIAKPKSDLNLQINNLELIDIKLNIENHLKKNKLQLQINKFQSDFTYINNKILSSPSLDAKVDSLIIGDNVLLADDKLNFDSNIEVITDSILVKIKTGSLSLVFANLNVNGIFDSKNNGYINLSISASDKDFSMLSLVLSDNELKNLKTGDLLLKGSIKGKTFVEFPEAEIFFGLKNVDLVNPVTQRTIKNLNLTGYFTSGDKDNFSKALLQIDTLYSNFPDGKLELTGLIKNFNEPDIDFNIFLKADVTGLDKVFKLDFIDDLKGNIEINDRVKGKYIKNEKRFASEINLGRISLENLGFNIPKTIKFDKINGTILRENENYYIDNLSILSDDTDIWLKGGINNLQYLFFNIEKDIKANLLIKSSVFDLPNFLAFDPSIKRDFNYRILDVDIDVVAKTTTSEALHFNSFPQIDFDIKKLNVTVENFLPPLNIKSGNFKISESILGFNLKCYNFKTAFLDGDFNFTAEYNTSKHEPFYIKAKTDFKEIYLSKLFYDEKDTIPESMKGKLSGSFYADLQFPVDSTILKFVNLNDANLLYQFSGDTITTKSLSLSLSDIYFNDADNSNPFATLTTKGKIEAAEFHSSGLNTDNIRMNFIAQGGTYKINSDQVRFFGKNAKGKSLLVLSPFSDNPSYHLNYTVNKFYAEEMLETFKIDTSITGPLSLTMDVNSEGKDWTSIVKKMAGSINLSGKNLIFYGMDADKLIEKFKRSQSFNLVDLGAVLLAGPVGIAVTKGSDYASILIANPGEYSEIKNLVSNWKIADGVVTIKDAAFTTRMNRIALEGLINFSKDSLDLTIALLNKHGCSVFSQNIYGYLNKPTLGKLQVVGTILSPLTNLVDDILGNECVPFYTGSVKHPIEK